MRSLIALVMLNVLAACGTKTPLTLPPQAAPKTAAVSPAPASVATDNNNKAAESTQ